MPRVPAGNPTDSGIRSQDPACFRREVPDVYGADAYRNSTRATELSKSPGKPNGDFAVDEAE